MAFLKVFLLLISLLLLPGCDSSRSVSGQITRYHVDAQDNLTGLTVLTDEGQTMTFVPTEDEEHLIVFWLGADTLPEIKEKFPNEVLVQVQYSGKQTTLTDPDGTTYSAYLADSVMDTAHLTTRNAFTFPDGVSADLWEENFTRSHYALSDGTVLLRIDGNGPENVYVGGTESFNDLTPAAQEKVLAFYEEQGLLYDEITHLLRAYSFYQNDPDNFQALLVGQDISPCFSNENIVSFSTAVTEPISPGYIDELRLCHTFDRKTGERISNYDLFTVPPEELLQLLLDHAGYENWENAPSIEEMQAALRPEYIRLSQNHISITFPKGSLPSQEHGYGFGLSIFGQRWDALQEWAQPLPRE